MKSILLILLLSVLSIGAQFVTEGQFYVQQGSGGTNAVNYPAVVYDSAWEKGAGGNSGTFSYVSNAGTVAGTVGNNSNRVLYAYLCFQASATTSGSHTVTWAGTSMTCFATNNVIGAAGVDYQQYLFYLAAPALGAQTISAAYLGSSGQTVALGAISVWNANQTNCAQNLITNNVTGTSDSVTVSTTSGNMVIAAQADDNASSPVMTAPGQEAWSETAFSGNYAMGWSNSVGSTAQMAWTAGSSKAFGNLAFEVPKWVGGPFVYPSSNFAIDFMVNMTNGALGGPLTVAELTNGTTPKNFASWTITSGLGMGIGGHSNSTLSTFTLSGVTYPTTFAARCLIETNNHSLSYGNYVHGSASPVATLAGYIWTGPSAADAGTWDLVRLDETPSGHFTILQLATDGGVNYYFDIEGDPGGSASASAHITATPHKWYWWSLQTNFTAGTNRLDIIDPVTWTLVGTVNYVCDNSGQTMDPFRIGQVQTGTGSGTNCFQSIVGAFGANAVPTLGP